MIGLHWFDLVLLFILLAVVAVVFFLVFFLVRKQGRNSDASPRP